MSNSRPWTDAEYMRAFALRIHGCSYGEIGRALGRTAAAVRVRLGKGLASGAGLPWTRRAERQAMRWRSESGWSFARIGAELKPPRTEGAVRCRLIELQTVTSKLGAHTSRSLAEVLRSRGWAVHRPYAWQDDGSAPECDALGEQEPCWEPPPPKPHPQPTPAPAPPRTFADSEQTAAWRLF